MFPCRGILGVDLGTTKFSVAVVIDGNAEILCNDVGGRVTPACALVDGSKACNEWEVGLSAYRRRPGEPYRAIVNSKFLLGVTPSEFAAGDRTRLQPAVIGTNSEGSLSIILDAQNSVTAKDVTASFFEEVVKIVKLHLECEVPRALVVTVPNYFTERQREELAESASIANFQEVKLVPDTVAAAVAYAGRPDVTAGDTVLFIDIGGGGGGLCICKIIPRNVEIITHSTVRFPGGDDFSRRVLNHLLKIVKEKYGVTLSNGHSLAILQQQCEIAKQKLSRIPEVTIKCFLPCNNIELNEKLTRLDFENMCNDLFIEISSRITEAITDYKFDSVVIVGGCTRIPALEACIKRATGKSTLRTPLNAEEAAVVGAALLSAQIVQVKDLVCQIGRLPHPPSWYEGAPLMTRDDHIRSSASGHIQDANRQLGPCPSPALSVNDSLKFLFEKNIVGEIVSLREVSKEHNGNLSPRTVSDSGSSRSHSPVANVRPKMSSGKKSVLSDSDEESVSSVPDSPIRIRNQSPDPFSEAEKTDDNSSGSGAEEDNILSTEDKSSDGVPYYLRVGDFTLDDVLNYLKRVESGIYLGRYPESCDNKDKRKFRMLCKPFQSRNGVLYHRTHAGKKTEHGRDGDTFPDFVPVAMTRKKQLKYLKMAHAGTDSSLQSTSLSAHRGEKTTNDVIARRVYWPGFSQDVKDYVRSCDTCQRVNPAGLKVHKPLQSIPPPRNILKQIGIDLIQLPESNGFKYVVVAIDYLSKFPHAKALPDKTAAGVARFLFEWISLFGCPSVIINDQGKEFCNEVSKELQNLTGVKQRVTRPYHPQANGQVERENRSIKAGLLKVLLDNVKEWPNVLDGVLFALRTQVQRSTGYSPFFMLYQQDPVLPIDVDLKPPEDESEVDESDLASDDTAESYVAKYLDSPEDLTYLNDFVAQHMALKQQVLSKARSNIKAAQATQRKEYNRRFNTDSKYRPGEKVLKLNLRRCDRKGGWQEEAWTGPYLIISIDKNGDCTLKNCRSGRVLAQKHVVDNFKPYVDRRPGFEDKSAEMDSPDKCDIEDGEKSDNSEDVDSPEKVKVAHNVKGETVTNDGNKSNHSKKSSSGPGADVQDPEVFNPPTRQWKIETCKRVNITIKDSAELDDNINGPKPLTKSSEIQFIQGEGNCFFRSISYILTGSEKQHPAVRRKLVTFMKSEPRIAKYTAKKSSAEYIKESCMGMLKTWATDAEIFATALWLSVDVFVECRTGWQRFSCTGLLTDPIRSDYALYLRNTNADHYDVVLDVE